MGILVGEEAAEGTTVLGGDEDIFEALADFGVGVDDADEESGRVVALIGSEVGADAAAFEEELVAGSAGGGEERFTLVGVAGAGGDDLGDGGDAGFEVAARGGWREESGGGVGDGGILVGFDACDDIA